MQLIDNPNIVKPETGNRKSKTVFLRRLIQILFFGLFFLLFLKADYGGQEKLAWPVDLFFRFDPLLLAVNLLSRAPLVAGLFWSLVLVGLTLILGRFFCGWVCPMGTALDGFRVLLVPKRPPGNLVQRLRRLKYYLLFSFLIAALLSVNLAGLFDPLCLLYRTLAIVFYPALANGLEGVFVQAYQWGKPLTYLSEPVYGFMKATVLPFRPLVLLLPFITLAIFGTIVALEWIAPRFWCRTLCPLGALYGLAAHFSWLRRRPGKVCPDCGQCQEICKMGAMGSEDSPRHQTEECQLCLNCLENCQENRIKFVWGGKVAVAPLNLGRRQVITSLAVGVVAGPILHLGSLSPRPHEYLLRPPGAGSEAIFLSRCVRCGQCFKVCPTGALQPALWEAGLEGLYTSQLVPRLGYCEYSCDLCSQVCPTGAIPRTSLEVKQAHRLGTAFVNRSRCIPFTEGRDCLVCEEHCPVSPKAITFYETQVADASGKLNLVKVPVVSEDRCIGCGACENKCPVGGAAAIRVKRSLRMEI